MKKIAVVLAIACLTSAASAQFYGGDFNGVNGLSSEKNTIVSDAYVFDNFNWGGGPVATVFGRFLSDVDPISGGEWEIRSGISEGNGGTLVLSGTTVISWTITGPGGFGFPERTLVMDGGNANLPAGSYWVGVRPIGNGSGRAFVETTSGTNGIGGPLNDGNSFFHSSFFGTNYTKTENILGAKADFSYGVTTGGDECYADCDGSGELDVDDFICFQTAFGTGDKYADCDSSGELDIDDFICYQTEFGIGCGG